MSYTQAFNPDTVPSHSIQRGLIFGAKCPISHQEFLNLTDGAVDETIKMNDLVAAQKLHTWGIIFTQDEPFGPRDLSAEDRRRLWLSDQE